MYNIIFVCYGNICRSPMAEMIFKDLIYKNNKRYKYSCISRATSIEEIGNPLYPPALHKLEENGIKVEKHIATQLKKEDYDKYDLIIVMEEQNKKDVLKIVGEDPLHKIHYLMEYTSHPQMIADPWYTGDFDTAFKQIYEGCLSLFNYLESLEVPHEI